MTSSDQPTSVSSTADKEPARRLLLIGILAMALILTGIAGYFILHRPKYSDDPRLDRAARLLVAYCPRVQTSTGEGRLASLFGGEHTPFSGKDGRKATWLFMSTRVLQMQGYYQVAETAKVPAVPVHLQGNSASPGEGTLADWAVFENLSATCMTGLGTDSDQTLILLYALGLPWPQWRTLPGGPAAAPTTSPPPPIPVGDKEVLERCLRLVGKSPGWHEADRTLMEREGLTEEQRLYVRAELVRRGLADPFSTEATYDQATALLRTHVGLDANQARGFLAVLAIRAIMDAPAAERDALRRSFDGGLGYPDSLLQTLIEIATRPEAPFTGHFGPPLMR